VRKWEICEAQKQSGYKGGREKKELHDTAFRVGCRFPVQRVNVDPPFTADLAINVDELCAKEARG